MTRFRGAVLLLVASLLLLAVADRAGAQQGAWGTVKGKVVWVGDMPKPATVNVIQDKQHCLSKGDIPDESLVVNAKNKGVKWVLVWLTPMDVEAQMPIHPDLKAIKKKEVELDQPICRFVPRAIAIREGQDLVVNNPAPMLHNIKWTGNPDINPGGNQGIPPGRKFTITALQAQRLPLILECSVHPWMRARLAVFNHPYFAVTDDDGNFEIKDAPAGKFRLFVWQESIGWRNGREGGKGMPIEIKAGNNDLGKLDLK